MLLKRLQFDKLALSFAILLIAITQAPQSPISAEMMTADHQPTLWLRPLNPEVRS